MPKVGSQLKPHICKYCSLPVARNIQPCGRFKGYYRTCGSEQCLTKQFTDPAVNNKKRFRGEAICIKCKQRYRPESARQKWCKECAPNKRSRRILQRYDLSAKEHADALRGTQICPICRDRPAVVVDHDHTTGKVRGLLCNRCNTDLPFIEDPERLARAIQYIQEHANTVQKP